MPATTTVEDVVRSALTAPGVAEDLEVYDVEVSPGLVRVLVERPGGVDLEALTAANRIVSAALDAHDPISGHYTLEVSSPGLERPLRTPEHFTRQLGQVVKIKTRTGVPGERRVSGKLTGADGAGVTVALGAGGSRRLAYAEIDRARTVFEWTPDSKRPDPSSKRPNPKQPNPKMRSSAT